MDGIVIDGVIHIPIKSDNSCYNCKECSLFTQCNNHLDVVGLCVIFGYNVHFEIENNKDTILNNYDTSQME